MEISIEEMNEYEKILYEKVITDYENNLKKIPKKYFGKPMYISPIKCHGIHHHFKTLKECINHMRDILDYEKKYSINKIFINSGRYHLIEEIQKCSSDLNYIEERYGIDDFFYKDTLIALNSLKERFKIQFGEKNERSNSN